VGATAPAQAAAEGVTHVGATAPAHAAAEGVTHVGDTSPADAAVLLLGDAARAVLELAAPMLAAAAIAAILVHLAQTRGLWLPRRALPGAPQVPRHDVRRTALDLAGALAIGAVCLGWLWTTAPQLALLVQSPRFAAAALASLLAALAIALLVLGVIDTLVRHVQLASALAMTRDEKREDDRLAAADPRWRAQRLSILRGNTSDAVARSSLVLLGDDLAIAVAWDPIRQPVPLRVATGRRARATQLVALARRHRVAVHRDSELAARLVDHEGPVPESDWPRLAPIIAAARRQVQPP
jgi:flagellar biosynthesis protein FlhB